MIPAADKQKDRSETLVLAYGESSVATPFKPLGTVTAQIVARLLRRGR